MFSVFIMCQPNLSPFSHLHTTSKLPAVVAAAAAGPTPAGIPSVAARIPQHIFDAPRSPAKAAKTDEGMLLHSDHVILDLQRMTLTMFHRRVRPGAPQAPAAAGWQVVPHLRITFCLA